MKAPVTIVTTIALATVSVSAQAQQVPSQVKWGIAIGGVTGAAVGGLIASRRHCEGENCVWGRGLVTMAGIGGGAAVGVLVGGALGHAIADHAEFHIAPGRVQAGIRLAL